MRRAREGGGWSQERPPSASVRSLFADEADRASATAIEEWYETERLTGHITGGARTATPTDRPTPAQDQAAVVLDWRHIDAPPAPGMLDRLWQSLDARRHRNPPADTRSTDVPGRARTRGRRGTLLGARSQRAQDSAPQKEEPAADRRRAAQPSGPLISLRGDGDQTPVPRHEHVS